MLSVYQHHLIAYLAILAHSGRLGNLPMDSKRLPLSTKLFELWQLNMSSC